MRDERRRLRRAAHKARNISNPSARAAALRKVRRMANDVLERMGDDYAY